MVEGTAFDCRFLASNALTLSEEDVYGNGVSGGPANYWLARDGETTGEGFTIKLDNCARAIAGCQIKNKGKGDDAHRATKGFQVSGSLGENGPWKTLVRAQLKDTTAPWKETGDKPASLLNFTFDQPVEIQFLRFDLISYWRVVLENFESHPPSECSQS